MASNFKHYRTTSAVSISSLQDDAAAENAAMNSSFRHYRTTSAVSISSLQDDAAFENAIWDAEIDDLMEVPEDEATSNDMGVLQSILPTLIISIFLGLVAGTLYGFGRYAMTLKRVLALSQSQVQTLGIWMDCGNYVGHPLTGFIYDRQGPVVSCLLASIIVFFSYRNIRLTLMGHHDGDDLSAEASFLLNLAFCGVGFGSGLGYIAGLGSTTKALSSSPSRKQYFGTGIGLVAAGYGMSSTLVGLTYQHLPDLPTFFRFWALIFPAVSLYAAAMFRIQVGMIESEDDTEESSSRMIDPVEQPLLSSTNLKEGPNQEDSSETVPLNHDGWNSWKTPEFWLLFLSFSCVTGAGLMVINNLSTMVESMGGGDTFATTLILVLSFSNVGGRILFGLLGDSLGASSANGRIKMLQGANLMVAFAMFLGYISGQLAITLAYLVILVALAYGGSWVLIVALASNLFGKTHFGKDYGLLALGPALSGLLFNRFSAMWYEQRASSSEGDDNTCLGSKCYETSYLAAGLVAFAGYLVTVVLYKVHLRKEQ